MTTVRIGVDDTNIQAALNRLLQVSQDMTPVMKDIAEHLVAGVRGRFRAETDPDGKKWAALSETTKKRKAKSGRTGARILHESGNLKDQITSDHDAMSAVVGTNVAHAPTHQFGALWS